MRIALLKMAMTLSLLLASLGGIVVAQGGLGDPGAYLGHSPATIGGTLDLRFGHPLLPNRSMLLGISGDFGPEVHPTLGLSFLSYSDPGYQVLSYVSDGSGEVSLSLPIPPDLNLWNVAPLFAHAYVSDPAVLAAPGYGLTKTVRVQFETQDGWRRVGDLGTPRSLFSATSLARDQFDDETRVLIAGGGRWQYYLSTSHRDDRTLQPYAPGFHAGPPYVHCPYRASGGTPE